MSHHCHLHYSTPRACSSTSLISLRGTVGQSWFLTPKAVCISSACPHRVKFYFSIQYKSSSFYFVPQMAGCWLTITCIQLICSSETVLFQAVCCHCDNLLCHHCTSMPWSAAAWQHSTCIGGHLLLATGDWSLTVSQHH